jgi:hypothetical protein
MGGDPEIHKRMKINKFKDPTVPSIYTKQYELE